MEEDRRMNMEQPTKENLSPTQILSTNDQTHITKGKRTKRQRPISPNSCPMTTNHSSSGNSNSSQTSSGEFFSTTIEEEDTAKCLILLSQGQSNETPKNFTSKRFFYECKTCNRSFTSFQALGGHRASHKKPKNSQGAGFEDDQEIVMKTHLKSASPTFLSLQLINKAGMGKVHECSICGAEFNSGQALGGHMRRHRGPIGGANTSLSLSPMGPIGPIVGSKDGESEKVRNGLCLDLNLPAPEESNFGLVSKQEQKQQPGLVY